MSNSLRPRGQQPIRLLYLRDSLGKNTGVGCHFLLQCGTLHQCILLRWSILAFQEKSHLCMVYNSYSMNRYKWLYIYIYAHNFSSGFLNPGRVAGGQAAALDHRSFACNYSWLLLLLIPGCCFTQSMTIWLRPASPAHLLRPISYLRVSHCTPSFWVSLRLHHSSLSVREPEREANARKCFPLKLFLFYFYSWVIV